MCGIVGLFLKDPMPGKMENMGAAHEFGQFVGDKPVAGSDALIGRQAEADDIDIEQGRAD